MDYFVKIVSVGVALYLLLQGYYRCRTFVHNRGFARWWAIARLRFRKLQNKHFPKPKPPLEQIDVLVHSGSWNHPVDWIYARLTKDPKAEVDLIAHYPNGGQDEHGRKVPIGGFVVPDAMTTEGTSVISMPQFRMKYTSVPVNIVGRIKPSPPKPLRISKVPERELTPQQAKEKEAYLQQLCEEFELKERD